MFATHFILPIFGSLLLAGCATADLSSWFEKYFPPQGPPPIVAPPVVEPPKPQIPTDAINPKSVVWLDDNPTDWPVNARLNSVVVSSNHRKVTWKGLRLSSDPWYAESDYKPCPGPEAKCVDGNLAVIAKIKGKWYGCGFQYLLAGRGSDSVSLEWKGTQPPFIQAKRKPISKWRPVAGERIYFVQVSLPGRPGNRGRSNILGPVVWP